MKTGLQSLPPNSRSRSEVQGASVNSWTNHDPRNLAAHKALPRPDWLPESVWPFETFGLPVDGARFAVTDVGRGPVLLFVHTGLWSFIWRDVIARLAQDFRCVCFDSPEVAEAKVHHATWLGSAKRSQELIRLEAKVTASSRHLPALLRSQARRR